MSNDNEEQSVKRYAVGKCSNTPRLSGRRWFQYKKDAVAYLEKIGKRDPVGLANGDYYFDGPKYKEKT